MKGDQSVIECLAMVSGEDTLVLGSPRKLTVVGLTVAVEPNPNLFSGINQVSD